MPYHYLIVGSGFSGCVLANKLINGLDCKIEIWDERNHIGGNSHTERDLQTNIMVHKYGPHIFNTDNKEIWDYVNRFVEFKPYIHRVKANSNGHIYSLPVNLHTINQFFNKALSPAEAEIFLDGLADKSIATPKNFEEQALRYIGKDLYDAFFYGYTKKQWGCEPSLLPASILKRLPVRFNYNDNYYNNLFSGIPEEGYSAIMQKMIDHPGIHLCLNKKFHPGINMDEYDHVFFTGPIDAFFDHRYGRLGYRTVTFETIYSDGDYQGVSQMNYCDEEVPYTRITEHKHFTYWEHHDKTICFKEYSKETTPADIPYYPKRQEADKKLLKRYREDAEKLTGFSFLGRLATYRYMDMHHVIGEAIQFASAIIESIKANKPLPVFSNTETV